MKNAILIALLLTQYSGFTQRFIEIPDVQTYQLITDGTGNGPTLSGSDQFGRSVADIGDLNNDGINDIVVGAPQDDAGASNAGAVYICFMNANGTAKTSPAIAKINSGTTNFTSLSSGDNFGVSVTGIGDLNGDGNEDIVVGASGHDASAFFPNAGRLYVIFLNSSGGVVGYSGITLLTSGFPGTIVSGAGLGTSVANLGDINGDGTNDIIAGASEYDGTKGGAFVIKFRPDASIKGGAEIKEGTSGFGSTLIAGDRFGYSVCGFGDANGDGKKDAIVGANGVDDGYTNAGAIWILYLDTAGLVLDEKKLSNPLTASHYYPFVSNVSFGECLGTTDINEDGITDIIAGVKTFNSSKGAFCFMVLDTDRDVKAIRTIGFNYSWNYDGPATAPQFGVNLCEIDLGASANHKQFVIGANLHANGGSTGEGSVYVITMDSLTFDFPVGTVTNYTAISKFSGDLSVALDDSDFFGIDGATIGDVNNDGVDDVVVGAFGDDDGASNAGAAYVLFMREDGRVNTYQKISNGNGDLNTYYTLSAVDQFGSAVGPAGDFNNDGVEDVIVGAYTDGATDKGALYLLYLGVDGKVDGADKITIAGAPNTDFLGVDVDTVGDLDNDGVVDFVAGAYQNDDGGTNRGAVYIIFMNSDGSVKGSQRISDTQGGFTDTLANSDLFGISVDGIGDFDGDNVEDIAVGSNRNGTGAVYIIYLNTNGTVKDYVKINNTMGTFPYTLKPGQVFGQSVQMVPDIDGNGIRDLLICSLGYKTYNYTRAGVWIAFLDASANVIDATIITDSSGKFYTNMHDVFTLGTCTRYYGLDSIGNVQVLCGTRDDGGGIDKGGAILMSINRAKLAGLQRDYAELKRQPDGGVHLASPSRVKFIYDEEYEVGSSQKLQYKLYKNTHQLVAEVNASGTATIAGSPLLPVVYGRNLILANFSTVGLGTGDYLLEVTTSKQEKRYLKFKI